MGFRVSTAAMTAAIAQAIESSQQRAVSLQQSLVDGRAIHLMSDDPVKAEQALWFKEHLRAAGQYERNLDGVISSYAITESTIQQMQDIMGQIQSLQTTGSDDAQGAGARRALASQIGQLTATLVELGNTKYAGTFLFGGRSILDAPLQIAPAADGSISAIRYNPQGVTGKILRKVGPDSSLTVNVTVADLFGQGGELFQTLAKLRTALEANDGERVRALAAPLEKASDAILLADTTVGALTNRAEALRTAVQQDSLSYEQGRSRAEDLDTARAAVDLQAAQVSLQAALASSTRILTMSLLDYLP